MLNKFTIYLIYTLTKLKKLNTDYSYTTTPANGLNFREDHLLFKSLFIVAGGMTLYLLIRDYDTLFLKIADHSIMLQNYHNL